MVFRAAQVADLEAALASPIDFVADPDDDGWFHGVIGAAEYFVRLGNFPDEHLYSLYLGHGRWMDFTALPDNWTVTHSPTGPPDTARARLPKGEFHV
ncbi:hypothetical protein QSJ18_07765 [Gordonia sp. ABSL1-1]|uniref:hypothetical protein n=1 Tax=Gordonia sp. ABSL1-1 TaxID=3053923 RepID=UPI002574625A|nr:hypothetical protein [Gordonia sp. ABSL1-1]MDL9936634.1 hypothetical protein [Gordonia sp. ABSL1-1]